MAESLEQIIEAYEAMEPGLKKHSLDGAKQVTATMVWVPNPGPQRDAYLSEADELFYGGGAGGGKSDLLLGLALNTAQQARIFRRHFKDVDGVGGLAPRMAEIRGTWSGYHKQQHLLRLGRGREIEFGAFTNEQEAEAYQGRPTDLFGIDEITQHPEKLVRFLMTWNRSAKKGQRVRAVFTGNPPVTPEGRWVIAYFAPWLDPEYPNPALPGELRWVTTIGGKDVWVDGPEEIEVDDGKGGVEKVKPKSRTYIPAALEDNPDLVETNYGAQLAALPEPYRSAFKHGNFQAGIQDDDWQVIPTDWILKAQMRYKMRMEDPAFKLGPMTSLGVDVAQGGPAATVLAPLHYLTFMPLIKVEGINTKLGSDVAALVLKNVKNNAIINIDGGGGWGLGAFEHLTENGNNAQLCIGAAGTKRRDRSAKYKFKNKRAEWWWSLREALHPETGDGLAIPPDAQLLADLTSVRRKKSEESMIIQIEEKAEIISRIQRSPDDGDALVLAWANDDPDLVRERVSRERKRAPGARSSGVQSGYASAKAKFRRGRQ